MTSALSIEGLSVAIDGRPILADLVLHIAEGETLGLVGESGSGKSMTARAVTRTLPRGATLAGHVTVAGVDVPGADAAALRDLRTRLVATVHQDPRAALNPLRSVGDFVTEGLRLNAGVSRRNALRRAVELLAEVGLAEPERLVRRFPHELSGGMLQRVVIAAALAGDPRLLLADEATTALDVTTQAEIIALLGRLARERSMAILFITHDLQLAAAICDRTAVMYAGAIVETGPSAEVFERPLHPYTAALLASAPHLRPAGDSAPLVPIAGRPIARAEAPAGCAFAPRCPHARPECAAVMPPLTARGAIEVACIRVDEITPTDPRITSGSPA